MASSQDHQGSSAGVGQETTGISESYSQQLAEEQQLIDPTLTGDARDRAVAELARGERSRARARGIGVTSDPNSRFSAELRLLMEDVGRYRRYKTTYFSRLNPGDPFMGTNGALRANDLLAESAADEAVHIPTLRNTKMIGINALKSFSYEDSSNVTTKYGNGATQFTDCATLGAKVIRQHGVRDFLWGMVSDGQPVPLASGLYALINSPDNISRIAELLKEAERTNVRLIFTFLTLGGGSDDFSIVDPQGEMRNVLQLDWSADHFGKTIGGLGGYKFDYMTGGTLGSRRDWAKTTLDIRSGYKRHYFGLIAEQIAILLLAGLAEAFGSPSSVPLSELVAGIEIFNEVEQRDRFYTLSDELDIPLQASYWALAYVECARAFYLALGGEVPILLPGLSSYKEGADGKDWNAKIYFLENFLQSIQSAATLSGLVPSEIAKGIDYHWYHRESGHGLHIGYLIAEVTEIRAQMNRYISPESHITEFESGVSVDTASGTGFFPEVVRLVGKKQETQMLEPHLFQANEVWRRLGGALASDAHIAGWHSWMSTTGGAFAMMGLREDSNLGTDRTDLATTRWSWFSFQRLSAKLGNVVSGKMLLPEISRRSEFASANANDYLVVFEFILDITLASQYRIAYVILYDPVGPANGAFVTAYNSFSGVSAQLVGTRITADPTHTPGPPRELPTGSATFDPNSAVTLPATFTVLKEDSALLLFSTVKLKWDYVDNFYGVPV